MHIPLHELWIIWTLQLTLKVFLDATEWCCFGLALVSCDIIFVCPRCIRWGYSLSSATAIWILPEKTTLDQFQAQSCGRDLAGFECLKADQRGCGSAGIAEAHSCWACHAAPLMALNSPWKQPSSPGNNTATNKAFDSSSQQVLDIIDCERFHTSADALGFCSNQCEAISPNRWFRVSRFCVV